jgi:hypothetical protein
MTRRTRPSTIFIAAGLAILTWACGGSSSFPASLTPPAPLPTYTLSGGVVGMTATGLTPIEGVVVQAGQTKPVRTDANGFYTIPGLDAAARLTVTTIKAGYATGQTNVAISGDTRLDIQLVRVAIYTLSGVVSEVMPTGLTALEGVRIEVLSCAPDSNGCSVNVGQSAVTDKHGFYMIPGLYAGKENAVWVSIDGNYYADDPPPSTPCEGCFRVVTINGDTRVDIQLVRH